MDEFILLDPDVDEDYKRNYHINSTNSLRPLPNSLIIEGHLDRALKEINELLYEDVIDLWKTYGES